MRDAHKSNSEAPKNQAAASIKVFPVPDQRRRNSLVTGYWLLVAGYTRSTGTRGGIQVPAARQQHRQQRQQPRQQRRQQRRQLLATGTVLVAEPNVAFMSNHHTIRYSQDYSQP